LEGGRIGIGDDRKRGNIRGKKILGCDLKNKQLIMIKLETTKYVEPDVKRERANKSDLKV